MAYRLFGPKPINQVNNVNYHKLCEQLGYDNDCELIEQ